MKGPNRIAPRPTIRFGGEEDSLWTPELVELEDLDELELLELLVLDEELDVDVVFFTSGSARGDGYHIDRLRKLKNPGP